MIVFRFLSSYLTGQASDWAEKVFKMILASSDQLLHVSLYNWLIEKNFIDKLLSIKSPYLENFLKRGTAQQPETLAMFDLLWKYYEKNSEYVPAAKILSKLADRHSTELTLSGRVQVIIHVMMNDFYLRKEYLECFSVVLSVHHATCCLHLP